MKRTLIATTALATALSLAALQVLPASAQQGGGAYGQNAGMMGKKGGGRMMQLLDTDGDGTITREEFDAFHDLRWDGVDINEDGEVTLDEFKAARAARRNDRIERRFQKFDADGDGVVTVEEIQTYQGGRFEQLDTDGDGAVSQTELRDARQNMRGSRGQGMGPQKGTGAGPSGSAPPQQ